MHDGATDVSSTLQEPYVKKHNRRAAAFQARCEQENKHALPTNLLDEETVDEPNASADVTPTTSNTSIPNHETLEHENAKAFASALPMASVASLLPQLDTSAATILDPTGFSSQESLNPHIGRISRRSDAIRRMCVTALVTKALEAQGGCPTYADFASVPAQNPFTRAAAQDAKNSSASAHGGTSQGNISQYNNGCSGSQISGDFTQPNSVHHNSMQSNHFHLHPQPAPSTNSVVLWAAVAAVAAALGTLMLVRTFKR